MEEAFLKDFLFPDEVVKFKSRKRMKFAGGRYMIYLTNQRLIAHRRRGLLAKKDDVIAERLEKIDAIRHLRRKLEIADENRVYTLKGNRDDVEGLWRQVKTCRLATEKLDDVQDINYSEKGLFKKTGVLLIQTSQRRLVFEGKPEEVKAVWREFKKSAEQREIGFT